MMEGHASPRTNEVIDRQFWQHITRREFDKAGAMMSDRCEVTFVLGNERIPTPADWIAIQHYYPGHWRARVDRIDSQADEVVTSTGVSDGQHHHLAISVFTIVHGRIGRLDEYWPEYYSPPTGRELWTRMITTSNRREAEG